MEPDAELEGLIHAVVPALERSVHHPPCLRLSLTPVLVGYLDVAAASATAWVILLLPTVLLQSWTEQLQSGESGFEWVCQLELCLAEQTGAQWGQLGPSAG